MDRKSWDNRAFRPGGPPCGCLLRGDDQGMTSDNYATSVSGPAALITAIPALLGFVPERSLVLITFSGDGDEIGTTMRHDLSLRPDGVPTALMVGSSNTSRGCASPIRWTA